jgi:hypothetical protein
MRLLPRLFENKYQTCEQEVTIKSNDFGGEARTQQALSGSLMIPEPKKSTLSSPCTFGIGIERFVARGQTMIDEMTMTLPLTYDVESDGVGVAEAYLTNGCVCCCF